MRNFGKTSRLIETISHSLKLGNNTVIYCKNPEEIKNQLIENGINCNYKPVKKGGEIIAYVFYKED